MKTAEPGCLGSAEFILGGALGAAATASKPNAASGSIPEPSTKLRAGRDW